MYPSASDNVGLSSPEQSNRPEFELAVLSRWRNWVSSSSYSPWNLHYITPPRPNDLPHDMDESPNGWADAFEDLLRASSHSMGGPDRPLADHHERLRTARKDRVDHRNVDRRWLWLAGLRADGLLGAAYPAGSIFGKHLFKPLTTQSTGWSNSSHNSDPRLPWVRALTGLHHSHFQFSFPWHSANSIFPDIAVGFHHDLEWPATEGRSPASLRDMAAEAFGTHSSLPQTEEDVFLRLMKDSEDVLDVLPKSVGLVHDRNNSESPGSEIEDSSRSQRTPGKHVLTEKFQNSDGTTTVVTREEKVDGKGNTRSVKTVTQTLDPEGNEISRSTESSYSRTWGGKWSWSSDDNDPETHDDGAKKKGESTDEPKKTLGSWLWK
ncbi:hypothetical protein MCOR25_006913 [Pyricularia grisea]|uniref:Uncharacterized protein n=1 Tax=Pyricularia grisea TaxID=148305 RepID=A0A6P8BDW5_PYRGI|nr:uncharacterized protein PgNI_04610 [Pyricularia grisea]KAI6359868.1 hypothetical protein MCOR25_006913 [Pyricularia grisea]TLD14010.1 hypothetical protein PgNI_04610 [Pyricularia grisea]